MNKTFFFIFSIVLFFAETVFANPKESQFEWLVENTSEHVTIIDATGRKVKIKKPIRRIVQNHGSVAELINIVGAWDMVVGGLTATISPELFPGIENKVNCISSANPFDIDYEKTLELQPDIFFTIQSPVSEYEELVKKLEPSIPVVALVNTSVLGSLDTGVRMLGVILDEQEKAEEYILWANSIKKQIGEKLKAIPDADRPRVFFKAQGWTVDQLCTLTDEMLVYKLLFAGAGGINIANQLPSKGGWVENVDPEWIVGQDYDIIVGSVWDSLHSGVLGYKVDNDIAIQKIRNSIISSELFAESKAVKKNRVYLYHADLGATQRNVIGIAYWAKWFHPDLFKELNPRAIHQEYLQKFMHVNLDLSTTGLLVYPEN